MSYMFVFLYLSYCFTQVHMSRMFGFSWLSLNVISLSGTADKNEPAWPNLAWLKSIHAVEIEGFQSWWPSPAERETSQMNSSLLLYLAVFLDPDRAHGILVRTRRHNSGWFKDLGRVKRKCTVKKCSYEEVREVFENTQLTVRSNHVFTSLKEFSKQDLTW